MKTSLRLCFALLLTLLFQGYTFAQTVTTTLSTIANVRAGITEQFNVTIQGGSGQTVIGQIDFTPYQPEDAVLQYRAPGAQEYTTLTINADGTAAFGPTAGFAFTAAATTHDFRILFKRGDTYAYTINLQTVEATPQTVASTSGNVTVSTPTQFPTIDGTLDQVALQKQIVVNQSELWQILVTTNEFAGVRGNIQVVLTTPAQRNNITLEYDVNRATTSGGDVNFQPLAFNEQGIATIGPEEGEVLTAAGVNQLMRINFSQAGTYAYKLRFLREDGNQIAFVEESITVANVAGIDDMIGDSRISVYPTLPNGLVKIDLGDVRNASIAVSDMLGRVVMEVEKATGSVQLNTSKLAKGTYFVKVTKGNDVAGSRFVVR